jgi:hypothetical protein
VINQPHDRQIVEAFTHHLRKMRLADVSVDCWLEDAFPGTSQVEAIAGHFAIEHTSCDTFHNQRATADWFDEIVTPIERLLSPAMPGRIRIYLPEGSISKGKDWSALRSALAVWVATSAMVIPDGQSDVTVPATGLTVRVSKDSRRAPLLIFWLEASNLPSLPERVRNLVLRKARKLAPHAEDRRIRVLLLESVDGANMSEERMLGALRSAFGHMPEGVDQLWFVDSGFNLAPLFVDFTPLLGAPGSAA